MSIERLSGSHLVLQTNLHLLQLLHLLGQLGHVASTPAIHGHHLTLLLQKQHLLLHHIHLHLNCLCVYLLLLHLPGTSGQVWNGCLSDVHHGRLEVRLVGKLPEEGVVIHVFRQNVAHVVHVLPLSRIVSWLHDCSAPDRLGSLGHFVAPDDPR